MLLLVQNNAVATPAVVLAPVTYCVAAAGAGLLEAG